LSAGSPIYLCTLYRGLNYEQRNRLMRDWAIDPTDHNLFPFEYIALTVVAAPAYIGAGCAHLWDRLAERKS
jgi:hypothetical protein